MSAVGIIAALRGELKPMVRGWSEARLAAKGSAVFQGQVGGHACVAACAGMGKDAATRACALAADAGKLDALISVGWAGAISCGVKPGEAYAVAEVIDAQTGERFPASFRNNEGGRVKLVSLDHVARMAEKRRIAETYLAVLVDMEAATVARIARARGIPFYCFRGVSDGATDKMPDFNRFLSNGHMRMAGLALYATARPQYWGSLVRMGKNSGLAATGLAEMVSGFLSRETIADGRNGNDKQS